MSLLESVAQDPGLDTGGRGRSSAQCEGPAVPAIELSTLTKTYAGARDAALKGVSLRVPVGSIFGLLGPNGAGKSTLINILAGLVRRTGGVARILGMDVEARSARYAIGVVPQEITLDPYFTARAALDLQAGLFGIPSRARRTAELLAALGLADKADQPARTLSGGMRRRLMVAKALAHSPPVLVLDEPTAGVDVDLRQQLWDYVQDLSRVGTTVLLTTHYLHEAEALCDHVAVLLDGRVIACDATETLLNRARDKVMEVEVDGSFSAVPPGLEGLDAVLLTPSRIALRYGHECGAVERMLTALRASGLNVLDLKTSQPTLEKVFIDLVQGGAPSGTSLRPRGRCTSE